VYAYVKGATVECVYLGWLRPPPGAPQQQWCLRECECDVRVDRHATTHGVPYAIRTIFSPFFVSENSAALPISHSRGVYALRIRITHHSAAPALGNTTDHTSRIRVLYIKRRKPAGEGYVLRTTYGRHRGVRGTLFCSVDARRPLRTQWLSPLCMLLILTLRTRPPRQGYATATSVCCLRLNQVSNLPMRDVCVGRSVTGPGIVRRVGGLCPGGVRCGVPR